jgi:hypothetical protein
MQIMKLYRVMLFMAALALWPVSASAEPQIWLRLSFIDGDVQVKTQEADQWGPASLNGPISEGDKIWVPEGGLAELQISSGTYIRLDENSSLNIIHLEDAASQFYLEQGRAYVFYDAPERDVIQIDTPSNSVRAYDNAVFRIDLSRNYTDVGVFDGRVLVESERGDKWIKSGLMLSLAADGGVEMGRIGEPDDWENWNNKRNALIASKGDSSRYLPEEIRTYSSDLDRHGRWARSDEYGYVWIPSDVDRDWAPYKYGRWIWRGGEYVWVGFEPWGWAPYHYGRWAYLDDYGWCWVPPARGQVYWGPGYVGWIKTDRHVAWVPLAPREIYYGHGNYGRFSIDISTRRHGEYEQPHEYAHFHHRHGVVIVEREGFASGKHVGVHIDLNLFREHAKQQRHFDGGAPRIKPRRNAYFAADRRISVEKAPPPRVREIRVRELKQRRRLVREINKSAFRPGAKSVELNVRVTAKPRRPHFEKRTRVWVRPAAISDKDKAALGSGSKYVRPGADKSRPLFQHRSESRAHAPGKGHDAPDKDKAGESGAAPGGHGKHGKPAEGPDGGDRHLRSKDHGSLSATPGGHGKPAEAPDGGDRHPRSKDHGSLSATPGGHGKHGKPAEAPDGGDRRSGSDDHGSHFVAPGGHSGHGRRNSPAEGPDDGDHRSRSEGHGSHFVAPGGHSGHGRRNSPAEGPDDGDHRSRSEGHGSHFVAPGGHSGHGRRNRPAEGPDDGDRHSRSEGHGNHFTAPGGHGGHSRRHGAFGGDAE